MVGAVAHRFDGGVEFFGRGDDDHLHVGIVLFGDLEDFDPADTGQIHVEQHQLDIRLLHHLQGHFAGRRAQHVVVALQGLSQRLAYLRVTVDHEDGFSAFRHAGREYNALLDTSRLHSIRYRAERDLLL